MSKSDLEPIDEDIDSHNYVNDKEFSSNTVLQDASLASPPDHSAGQSNLAYVASDDVLTTESNVSKLHSSASHDNVDFLNLKVNSPIETPESDNLSQSGNSSDASRSENETINRVESYKVEDNLTLKLKTEEFDPTSKEKTGEVNPTLKVKTAEISPTLKVKTAEISPTLKVKTVEVNPTPSAATHNGSIPTVQSVASASEMQTSPERSSSSGPSGFPRLSLAGDIASTVYFTCTFV